MTSVETHVADVAEPSTKAVLVKSGIYAASSGISQAIMFGAWAMLPWLITPAVLGQFALVSFVAELTHRFIVLGTDSAIIRFYSDRRSRRQVLRAAGAWVVAGVPVAAIVLFATRHLVPRLVTDLGNEYAPLLPVLLLTTTAQAVATLTLSHYIGKGDAKRFGAMSILRSLVTGAGFLVAGMLGAGVTGLLVAQLVAAVAIVASLLVPERGETSRSAEGESRRMEWSVFKEVGAYGLPLAAYTAFSLFSDYTGRLVLGRTAVLATLGVYQFYFQITTQVNGLWASLNRAWSPHVFSRLEQDRARAMAEIRRMVTLVPSLFAIGLALLFVACGFGIPQKLLPAAYADHVYLFGLLLLGALYTAIYTAVYPLFYFARNTTRIAVIQAIWTLATMFLTVVLTTRYGFMGAALGWVAGHLIAPPLYFASAPQFARELRAVLVINAVWGVVGAIVWALLGESRSYLLAGLVLAISAAIILWYEREQESRNMAAVEA